MKTRISAKPSIHSNARLVAEWNDNHPFGTAVEVTKDDGSIMETKTASKAWMLGGHTAVVMLAGIGGCYDLRRVRAL